MSFESKVVVYEKELDELVAKIHHLCEQHKIPFVAGFLLEAKEIVTKDGEEGVNTHIALATYVPGPLPAPHIHNAVFALESQQPIELQKFAGTILKVGISQQKEETRKTRFWPFRFDA